MLRTPESNPDVPESYFELDKLLDGRLDGALNSMVRKRFTEAIDAAMQMPAGPGRHAVLRAVSTGVSASVSRRELSQINEGLNERLRREMPDANALSETAKRIDAYVGLLYRKFDEAREAEKKRGTDLSKSHFLWFEHELHCFGEALRTLGRGLLKAGALRSAPVPGGIITTDSARPKDGPAGS